LLLGALESIFRFGPQPAYPSVGTVCEFRMILVPPDRVGAREDLEQPPSLQFAARQLGQKRTPLARTHGAIDFSNEILG